MSQKQHYISKVLTKPWEYGDRQLWCFDFDEDKIIESSAYHLFSRNDLWPQKYEEVFCKKFEVKLNNVRASLMLGPAKLSIKDSTEFINTILTMHFFDGMRSMKAQWGNDEIDRFIKLKSKDMNEEVESFAKDYTFVSLPVSSHCRFFFPESGFFHIPLFKVNSNEMVLGLGIPLHPQFALGMFPKNYDRQAFSKSVASSESILPYLSISSISGKRVIIHPDCMNINDAKLIEQIKGARSANIRLFNQVLHNSESLRNRAKDAYEAKKSLINSKNS